MKDTFRPSTGENLDSIRDAVAEVGFFNVAKKILPEDLEFVRQDLVPVITRAEIVAELASQAAKLDALVSAFMDEEDGPDDNRVALTNLSQNITTYLKDFDTALHEKFLDKSNEKLEQILTDLAIDAEKNRRVIDAFLDKDKDEIDIEILRKNSFDTAREVKEVLWEVAKTAQEEVLQVSEDRPANIAGLRAELSRATNSAKYAIGELIDWLE